MSKTIDTRGFSCPQPALMFLSAVKAGDTGPFTVLVDNDASLENVSRAAHNSGFTVETHAEPGGVTRIDISRT